MKAVAQWSIVDLELTGETDDEAACSLLEIKEQSRKMIRSSRLLIASAHKSITESKKMIAASKKSIADSRRRLGRAEK